MKTIDFFVLLFISFHLSFTHGSGVSTKERPPAEQPEWLTDLPAYFEKVEQSSGKLPSYQRIENPGAASANYFKILMANAMTLPVVQTRRLFEDDYLIKVSNNEKQFIKDLITEGIIYNGKYEPKIGAAILELIKEYVSERKPLFSQKLLQLSLQFPLKVQPISQEMADYKQELIEFFTNTFPSESREIEIQLLKFELYIELNACTDTYYKKGTSVQLKTLTSLHKTWAFRRGLEIPMFGRKLNETERKAVWGATNVISREFIGEKPKGGIIKQRVVLV